MSRFVRIAGLLAMMAWVLTNDYAGTSAVLLFVIANKSVITVLLVCGVGYEISRAAFDWE